MSVRQYLRQASLVVGMNAGEAIDLSELRFKFVVRRGDFETPNTADIRVYNVADNTAKKVESKEFTRLVLQCGYEGNFGIIFDGQIKQVRRGRETQTDTYLDITAADGDSAYNFCVTAVSMGAGSKPQDHLDALLKSLIDFNVPRGYIAELPIYRHPRGKVIFGMTRDGLRKVAENIEFNWSIQDSKLQMVPLIAYVPGEAVVVNAETGLIGLPEQTQNGIKLKVLLNPGIRIGRTIMLDNKSIQRYRFGLSASEAASNEYFETVNKLNDNGLYYVMVAEHMGDTRGNDWYTDVTCLAVDAAVPASIVPRLGVNGDVEAIKRYG